MLRHAIALVLTLLVLACGAKVEYPRLAGGATVLAFGDSLTYGTGVQPAQSYPAVLQALISREVVNEGIPGNTTADGRARLAEALDAHAPKLLILCLGGNDFLRKQPEAETVAHLRAMLDLAKARGVPVLLVATPKPGLGLSVPDFYAELAQEYGVALEDEVLAEVLADRNLKSDPIHPNEAGYRQMAEAIAAALRETGAI
ncbi:arylesterase [Chitinimonas sp. BJYL2]|uniref:arylesterase n=1 Tax=Chitinimonas sp. BJYL2 TaxID=2976696 RepID=UPI0022B4179F|nr:arylesterase [Chitinimonas sp. BJYL2]